MRGWGDELLCCMLEALQSDAWTVRNAGHLALGAAVERTMGRELARRPRAAVLFRAFPHFARALARLLTDASVVACATARENAMSSRQNAMSYEEEDTCSSMSGQQNAMMMSRETALPSQHVPSREDIQSRELAASCGAMAGGGWPGEAGVGVGETQEGVGGEGEREARSGEGVSESAVLAALCFLGRLSPNSAAQSTVTGSGGGTRDEGQGGDVRGGGHRLEEIAEVVEAIWRACEELVTHGSAAVRRAACHVTLSVGGGLM